MAIRASTNLLSNVSISAMHQSNDRAYGLYNKVLLLSGGRQIYFGRADKAREYFAKLGYNPVPTESTDDFLARISSHDSACHQSIMEKHSEESTVDSPLSPLDLETKWKSSPEYGTLIEEIKQYRTQFKCEVPDLKFPLYCRNYPSQLCLGIKRGYYRVIGDKPYVITTMIISIIHALAIGPLFFQLNPTTVNAFSKGGGLFFALIYNITVSLVEVPIAIANRPIFLKQRRYYFIRPSIENIQLLFTDLPIRSIGILLFALTYYFISGFRKQAGHFFLYLLTVELSTYSFVSYYGMIASIVRIPEIATTIVGISLVFFLSYSGYMITTNSMRPYFRWLNRVDPMSYGFEILLANEFHNRNLTCGLIAPSGPGYEDFSPPHQSCVFPGALPNETIVSGDLYMEALFGYKWSHVWRNIGIIIALWLAFAGIASISSEIFFHAPRGSQKRLRFAKSNSTTLDSTITTEQNKDVVIFTWKNLSYNNILDDISGYAKSSQMCAIIGENTLSINTLLNLLSLRIPSSGSGLILLDGMDPMNSTNSIGYVSLIDDHVPYQTVREALIFSARLRLPATMTDSEKLSLVNKVIRDLDMFDIANAWIGPAGHVDALSPFQRKKLSIGIELASKPKVLVIDDPSNFFDTVEGHKITALLRSLSNDTGIAIICSISEPTSFQLNIFDNVLLLDNSGQTCYFGSVGENLNDIITYFNSNPDETNVTDFLLKSVRSLEGCDVDRPKVWASSSEKDVLLTYIDEMNQETVSVPFVEANNPNSYFRNLRLVFCRTLVAYWRTPRYFFFKALYFAVAGLFVGFTYYKVGNGLGGLQNAVFAIFFSLILGMPLSAMIHDQVIPIRNHFETTEKQYRKTYHWSCLILSVFACELMIHIPLSTLFYVGLYFPVHFISTPGYFYFIYCIMFQLLVVSMTLGISFIVPDIMAANNLSSAAFALTVSFCGVPQRPALMTGLYQALYRVSPYTYFVQAYTISMFHNQPVVCKPPEYTVFQTLPGQTCQEYAGNFVVANGGYLQNPQSTDSCMYCQFATGDEFLKVNLSTGNDVKWRNVGLIFAYVVFNIVCMHLGFYIFRVRKWPSVLSGVRKVGRQFVFAKKSSTE